MNKNFDNLTTKSFAKIFGTKETKLPLRAKQAIQNSDFRYKIIQGKKYDKAILEILKTLNSTSLKKAGSHRQGDWEKGWEENLEEYKKDGENLSKLIPKFVRKGEYIRFQGEFIDPLSNTFETDFVSVLRYYLFTKYLKKINTFYEFGAGTGLNLVAASEVFPKIKLVGLDWAKSSTDILNTLKDKLNVGISGRKCDLFNPDRKYRLDSDSAVLTIGTLEQLGENFEPFINYLLSNKPKICIHFETLYELYDKDNLLDYLAVKYLEKRNYLKGFLPYLKKLEIQKKIKIIEVRRTFGSFYHEGYTYIVWKPI